MAISTSNTVVSGFRGKLGDALVFRTLRGKTFVSVPARKPDKRKETEAQRGTRVSFRQAAEWAQLILFDPEQKAYYQKRARTLKLPNAYTAALTDYLRKSTVVKQRYKDTMSYMVAKKGFNVKQVSVAMHEQTPSSLKMEVKNRGDYWIVNCKVDTGRLSPITLLITDNFNRVTHYADEG